LPDVDGSKRKKKPVGGRVGLNVAGKGVGNMENFQKARGLQWLVEKGVNVLKCSEETANLIQIPI